MFFDYEEAEELLMQIEDNQWIDSRIPYKLYRENGHLQLLGTGNTAYVFEAYDSTAPEHHYALKVIGLGNSEMDAAKVQETLQIQLQLSEQSPYIVRALPAWVGKLQFDNADKLVGVIPNTDEAYDATEGREVCLILTEKLEPIIKRFHYADVRVMRDELSRESGVIKLAAQVGNAIACMHGNGYLHRDIKLENIFYDPVNDCYKLGDFGISRFVGTGNAETVLYTGGYGAPEIRRYLQKSYNATADIYSFGMCLFLLLNELRFPGSDYYQPNENVQYQEDFVLPAPKHASEYIAAMIRVMCAYRPQDRYRMVEEVLQALYDFSYASSEEDEEDYGWSGETIDFWDDAENLDEPTEEKDMDDSEVDRKEQLLARERRVLHEQEELRHYRWQAMKFLITSTVLCFCVGKSFLVNESLYANWMIWGLLFVLFAGAILQCRQNFGIIVVAVFWILAIVVMCFSGISGMVIVMMIVSLVEIPGLSMGFSIGVGVALMQVMDATVAHAKVFEQGWLRWLFIPVLVVYVIWKGLLDEPKYEDAE